MLVLELLLPLGEVDAEPLTLPEALPPDGDVVVVSVDFDVEDVDDVSEDRGVVVGEADGLVRSGTVPTRSVSVRLHATVMPPASARAQRPDSNFFITQDPPLWGVFRPVGVGCNAHARGTMRARVRISPYAKETRGMKLEGSHDVPAPRQKVWDAFFDPARLQQAIPGCEKLESIGPDEYKATMKIGVGGVKGTFEGKVRLSEKKPPESYKMAVEGTGGPGFVRGETVITLSDAEGGGTRVAYNADVQVGGLIASVGQRMLGGVSKMMADKFFGKMSDLLKGT